MLAQAEMTCLGNPRVHRAKGKSSISKCSNPLLHYITSSAEGIHAVWSLRSRSGPGLIRLVLAGYPEIGVLPMSHFQHDRPYLC